MLSRPQLVEYYSDERIAKLILEGAKNREVAGAFWDGSYDKRPNILQYPTDIVQMVRKGVTSFHLSVEHWSNPMAITSENYEKLRTGWDMIIDIDSKLGVDESKIAAKLIVKLLGKYGIRQPGVKFSGRRGFHICVPFGLFPKEIDYKPLAKMYPDALRILASFIRYKIRKKLLDELIKSKGGVGHLVEALGEAPGKLSPFHFVEIEKGWGNRHMFRAPYSFNEKTWLVSVPVPHINSFSPKDAEFGNVLSSVKSGAPDFFGAKGDATDLLTDAMDWFAVRKKEPVKTEKKIIILENKIPEEMFPPCIKLILDGLGDGKKRSVYTLTNFLRLMNWTPEEIERKVFEWNTKNSPPLPSSFIISQLRWSQRNERTPNNCFDDRYTSIGVCRPDETCKKMNARKTSNPIAYPLRKMKPKKRTAKMRGFSCLCGKEFPTERSLALHKGKMH
ncbi:MAG: hypothetical protein QT00_C0001G0020 [archaeon GW2011_AR5]|nr:MAG: hypothetical protein QT00_C0001G0020 [archaeon GW2011_AR5]